MGQMRYIQKQGSEKNINQMPILIQQVRQSYALTSAQTPNCVATLVITFRLLRSANGNASASATNTWKRTNSI